MVNADLQEKTAVAEASPIAAEEESWCTIALNAVPADQREQFAAVPQDVLCVVRGFANEKDREKATTEAMAMIAAWRVKVGYYKFFEEMHPVARDFHTWWPEKIYGLDGWGHMLQGVRVEEIDSDKLSKVEELDIDKIQGQKMKAYSVYKQDLCAKTGQQRYKHTLIVDLTGLSMGMLAGSKRTVLQKILSLGSTYYPETMWQIYLINSPMIFRAVWAILKPWLHPITVNKIQIIGTAKEALKKMTQQNIPAASLPTWMGGGHPGKLTVDYVHELVHAQRLHGSLPA